jgi:NAD+ synthase
MTTLQEQIIQTLGAKPSIDAAQEIQERVNFLKQFTLNAGTKGFVLGISGGQDSALAGKLAQIAAEQLRAETGDDSYQFLALLLPYGIQKDAADALTIAKDFIKADRVVNFNIKDTVDAFQDTFNAAGDVETLTDYHKGNIKARVRMTTQYAYAGQRGLLVVGTDHNSEAVSGFFTKFGDGGADILPLAGLNKHQGKELLRLLDAPEFVITKAPTADLLDVVQQQPDETELGITSEVLDNYLEGETVAADAAEKIETRYLKTEHKRQLPVTITDTWWK